MPQINVSQPQTSVKKRGEKNRIRQKVRNCINKYIQEFIKLSGCRHGLKIVYFRYGPKFDSGPVAVRPKRGATTSAASYQLVIIYDNIFLESMRRRTKFAIN